MAKLSSWGINAGKPKTKRQQEEADEREDALKEEELRREKSRKERTLLIEAQEVHLQKAAQGLLHLWMAYHSLFTTLRLQEISRRKGTGSRCWNTRSHQKSKETSLRHGIGERYPVHWAIKIKVRFWDSYHLFTHTLLKLVAPTIHPRANAGTEPEASW